ncbi:MAG: acyl carrier protein [Verrucomicrobia bacterium]|nr:MAG: acyl carrier protein [Verrucomicrobiota bacterium]
MKEKLIESLDIPYEPSDLSEDISLIGSGLSLDSLDILEIVLCVESAFGIKMPEQSVPILRSFNTLVDFIMAETGARNA